MSDRRMALLFVSRCEIPPSLVNYLSEFTMISCYIRTMLSDEMAKQDHAAEHILTVRAHQANSHRESAGDFTTLHQDLK